jgi:hypothetical protein
MPQTKTEEIKEQVLREFPTPHDKWLDPEVLQNPTNFMKEI